MVFRTTTALEGLLVLFDPIVQYVAVINKSDGRIRVFNAITCALHVDITKKLGSKHRCFTSNLCSACWSLQDGSQTPRLIVAASSGRVVSFDISKASQIWSADDVVSGDLSWIAASGSGTVAAVSSEGDVVVHDAVTGKRKWKSKVSGQPLTFCTFPEDTDRLVVASTYLFVFNAKEVAVKLYGHAAAVCCAAVTPDGELTLSGAAGDNTLALFSSRLKKRKGENDSENASESSSKVPTRRAKLSLGLAEPPRSIACAACDAGGDYQSQRDCSHAFVAAAVTEGGTACVWRCTKERKSWRGHLRCSIRSGSSQESVLGVSFVSENVLLVVYGIPVQPRIHRVTLSPEAAEVEVVLPAAGQMLAPTHLPEKDRASSPRVIALGADNAGLPVNAREGSDSAQDTATPMDTDALPPHTATNGLASIDSHPTAVEAVGKTATGAGSGAGTARGLGGGIPEGEEPLMNRVAKLMPMAASQRVTEADVQGAGAAVEAGPQGAITADSLTVLLSQAIRAADDVLIDKVLSSGRGAVLKRTVARLAAADTPQFFTALVERLRRTPARAASVLPWLRAALTQHASVLAAAPSSRGAMSLLTQLAEQRTALLGPMLALRGRLDVLVASAQPLEAAGAPGVSSEPFKPLVEVKVADLKQRSLARFMRGEQSDSDDGDDQEELGEAGEGGPLGYEVEDVYAANHDEDEASDSEEIDEDDEGAMEGDVEMDDAEGSREGESDSEEGSEDGDEEDE